MRTKAQQRKQHQAHLRWMERVLLSGCLSLMYGLVGYGAEAQDTESWVSTSLASSHLAPSHLASSEQPVENALKQQNTSPSNQPANQPALENGGLPESLCPPAVLSRLQRHQIQSGETVDTIAAQYGLAPATLYHFNPSFNQGRLSPGRELVIPPYNGVRVQVSPNKTWQNLADQFNVRADVLFELNGCGAVPQVVFVPGASGLTRPAEQLLQQATTALDGFPLRAIAPVQRDYGWQTQSQSVEVEFHGGVDFSVDVGTPVLTVGDGIVAFAGDQGDYGKLVVINHAQGLQTRYAQLSEIEVERGQQVTSGQTIGLSGETGLVDEPHLHFEIRANSSMGWVAQDPANYLDHMQMSRR
ncbi:MAG: M23 family metallopeptidase [Elainellaceae cyanobacterium]